MNFAFTTYSLIISHRNRISILQFHASFLLIHVFLNQGIVNLIGHPLLSTSIHLLSTLGIILSTSSFYYRHSTIYYQLPYSLQQKELPSTPEWQFSIFSINAPRTNPRFPVTLLPAWRAFLSGKDYGWTPGNGRTSPLFSHVSMR